MANGHEDGAGDALRESERRLRLAVEAARIGIWDWNVLTNDMVWSDEAKAIAGLPLDRPVSFEQISGITHPLDLPRTRLLAQQALDPALRSTAPYEYRIVRPDGEVRWVLAHGEAVFRSIDGHPRAVRYIGTIRDITERKQSEAVLKESEARLRIAIDAARLGIWDYDVASGTLRGSPELARILGFGPDDRFDLPTISARYYPGDEAKVRAAGEEAVKRGERYFQAEFRFYWADGSLRWLLVRAEILNGPDGRPSGVIGAILDITDRKEAEERQIFLMRELIHRVRNTLASVRAIAGSTLRSSKNLKEAETALSARIGALADLHTLLSNSDLRRADLREIVAAVIAPYRGPDHRISVAGPALLLEEHQALSIAMALHELATNATKYGALSADGCVELTWTVAESGKGTAALRLVWQERDGPPVKVPRRRGFGMRLIEQAAGTEPGSGVAVDYAPQGLVCVIQTAVGRGPSMPG